MAVTCSRYRPGESPHEPRSTSRGERSFESPACKWCTPRCSLEPKKVAICRDVRIPYGPLPETGMAERFLATREGALDPDSRRSLLYRRLESSICRDFRVDNKGPSRTHPASAAEHLYEPRQTEPFRSTGRRHPVRQSTSLPRRACTSWTRNSPSRWRFCPLSPLTFRFRVPVAMEKSPLVAMRKSPPLV